MGIDDLVNDEERHRGSVEGVVAAPAPESVNDPLWVTVLGLDDRDAREGPCPWMPRPDDDGTPVLPEVGNPCSVDYTDAGTPWVHGYWPDKELPHD